jgi:hypothetical protein
VAIFGEILLILVGKGGNLKFIRDAHHAGLFLGYRVMAGDNFVGRSGQL